ncbi:MAG: FAD:protein FMN transferase [Hyphomicrobium sp.]
MQLSRRKFLVYASAAGVSCGLGAIIANGDAAPSYIWRGSALGGEARVALYGADADAAANALADVAREIERLENIFSLYREGSELSRLNSQGSLQGASQDLVDVLRAAARWKKKTDGAFNPLVQPLWQAAAKGGAISRPMLDLVNGEITIADDVAISPGSLVTLNGIAQGRIADRVTELLMGQGFDNVVIDAGELRIPGRERRAVGIPALKSAISVCEVAIATSEPKALVFDPKTFRHHLIDPRTGESPRHWESISVLAQTAEAADALSTAFAILPHEAVGDIVQTLEDVAVIGADAKGRVRTFGSRKFIG